MPTLISTGQTITNNFKVTCRNLLRNKTYSLINITGLAIGMAASILILLWIFDELSFDKFQKNRERIYHVMTRSRINGNMEAWGGTSMLLAPVLKANYSEVEEAARLNQVSAFMFHVGDRHIGGNGIITDPAFLKIFDYPLLQGSKETALNDPRSIIITESFAKKLFARSRCHRQNSSYRQQCAFFRNRHHERSSRQYTTSFRLFISL